MRNDLNVERTVRRVLAALSRFFPEGEEEAGSKRAPFVSAQNQNPYYEATQS